MMAANQTANLMFHPPRPGKKYFTLDEANHALVYVRPIALEMSECYSRVLEIRRNIEQGDPWEKEPLEAELERTMEMLGDLVDEMNFVGVEIKDFEKALIDFPAVHQNREIFYCWHLGEVAVQTWHEVDAGFAGRQDVTLLQAAA